MRLPQFTLMNTSAGHTAIASVQMTLHLDLWKLVRLEYFSNTLYQPIGVALAAKLDVYLAADPANAAPSIRG